MVQTKERRLMSSDKALSKALELIPPYFVSIIVVDIIVRIPISALISCFGLPHCIVHNRAVRLSSFSPSQKSIQRYSKSLICSPGLGFPWS